VDFPYEFDPRYLNLYTSCKYSFGNNSLQTANCKLTIRSFFISVNAIKAGNTTILIKNIRNPNITEMSSNFVLKTLFKSVVVTENLQFGKTPFTLSPSNNLNYFSFICCWNSVQLSKHFSLAGFNMDIQLHVSWILQCKLYY
jgi:Golgi nucleoside diphosphatase